MRRRLEPFALAALLLFAATTANAAVNVGSLDAPGAVIDRPILFTDSYGLAYDDGGLEFTIGTGAHGQVRLDLSATTSNTLVAASFGHVYRGLQSSPISFTDGPLAAGTYKFSLSAFVVGGGDGEVRYKLTLTPVPASLALFGPAAMALGALGLQRRRAAGGA